jgi:hypothetical protein
MRKALGVAVLASVFLLPACSDDGLPTDLPFVVTETSQQATVQVTVDPEGTVFTSRGGTSSRKEVPREEIAELRDLMADADLDSLDGAFVREPRYIILAGDVEIYLAADEVPKRLVPVLDWIEEHRE